METTTSKVRYLTKVMTFLNLALDQLYIKLYKNGPWSQNSWILFQFNQNTGRTKNKLDESLVVIQKRYYELFFE